MTAGCVSAENTIKRLLKNFTQTESANLPVETPLDQVQNDTNVIAQQQQQQQPTLSWSKPFMKFGKTIGKLKDVSSKKRSNERVSEPRPKVRRFENERCDNVNLECGIDDSNGIGSTLPSVPLDDDDDDDERTQTPEQVSQFGPSTEALSQYNVAASSQICVTGNVCITASEQQHFTASSVGQHVVNIRTSSGGTFPSVGPQIESAVSLSDVAVTLNGLANQLQDQTSLLQLPVEARKIACVAPTPSAKSSNAIQNSSSVGVNQQVVDLGSQHLSSSVQAEGVSSEDNGTAATSAVNGAMTGATVTRIPPAGSSVSLGSPTADDVTEENTRHCQYCDKSFPQNIIVHHRKLHFSQSFFSRVSSVA
ncbi:uncharacterized protein LOC110834366 [Zootermopsis nevadensis]|uniref:uncharacterized protein LOC110834366 n=1 Tax=Zootermopsis nevadensis TaxID=136037 RepID=UPI000B8EE549|nr:uncharacterized protein LOC110834366 [Zootermopsis nevadensis]